MEKSVLLVSGAGVGANHFNDGGVGEGGDIPKVAPLGDVAQKATHDLPGAGLRELWHKFKVLRLGDCANALPHVGA